MKAWNGEKLDGEWIVTYKLDGIKVIVKDGEALSRNGKPLYNLPVMDMAAGEYEVFKKDWETSVSMVRTHDGEPVAWRHLYKLEPTVDKRLVAATLTDPLPHDIRKWLKQAKHRGHEGLVLRGLGGYVRGTWQSARLKVKPVKTYDVKVTGIVPGTGKYKGMMGALMTDKGKVGSGFTDEQRRLNWQVGEVIEVESQGLTQGGRWRFPRFVRTRFDK